MKFKTYKPEDREYKLLEAAAAMLTSMANRTTFKIENVYWDFGAALLWTTIVAYRDDGSSWQALYPREHALITSAASPADLAVAVSRVLSSPYSPEM